MSRFFTGFGIGVRNQPRLAHEAGFALHPETGFGFNGLHGFSIVETSHGIAAQLVSRRAVDQVQRGVTSPSKPATNPTPKPATDPQRNQQHTPSRFTHTPKRNQRHRPQALQINDV
ncbi:hypothetical protein [Burkholderia vietnamiensis]|jgi:hypothetical protein|uniref:hypothetical protein n=1 Tax=Burkholderia vietnamiensis TaxID=60552 RepID=UPI00104106BF|nr:hypothetical protein [Burkholderia vietnamiensis]